MECLDFGLISVVSGSGCDSRLAGEIDDAGIGISELYQKSLFHIGVEDALLLQVMRHGVLRQKRGLEPNFGSNPFALTVKSPRRMTAAPSTAELRPEVGALDLIELLDLFPRGIAHRAGNVDFKMQDAHYLHQRTQGETTSCCLIQILAPCLRAWVVKLSYAGTIDTA